MLAGPAVELVGLPALGIVGVALIVPPVVLLLIRSKETINASPSRTAAA